MPILEVLSPDNHIFQVWEAGREEGRKEGVEEGRKEGVEEGAKASIEMLQELGISREEVQTKVQEKFLASDEIVKEWMSKYWK